ncbi:TolC family protein [Leadbetterella sp. DM7]|uniref:TolC family protein n=1 Tax=Leadbetterella sp. DM7 TaxID=3235085 RepID=UPI00349F026E
MNKLFSLVFILLAFPFLTYAQETRSLTLEEAVSLGLQASKTLRSDQARIEAATADYVAARNRLYPDFKLSGTGMALTNATVHMKMGGDQAEGGNTPKVNSALLANASVSYPLYTGGKTGYAVESARYLEQASRLSMENNKTAVAYTIAAAYNNLFKAGQALIVLTENLKAAQQRDRQFLDFENNAILARNDRLKASLQTSNIELQLLDAQNSFEIATIHMNLLLGLPENTRLTLDSAYITATREQLPATDYFLNQALENRKDLQALNFNRKAVQTNIRSARAEALPTVVLTGGYIAAEIPNLVSVINAANIGLGIQYNLDNLWKKNSRLMQTQAKEKQLANENDLLNDQIRLDINRDYLTAQTARKRTEVLQNMVDQADENYRITHNKYNNGLATMTELLDADAARIAAQISVLNARADAALAYKKLLQTTGIF